MTTACKWDTVIPLNEYILVGKKKLEYDKFLMLCYMNGVELDAAKEQWEAEKQIGLWTHFKRVLKPRGAAVLFGSQPFTSALVMSNVEWFKYEWIWEKGRATGCVHAKNKPLKCHENILVFSQGVTVHAIQSKNRMVYNPQMESGKPYKKKVTQPNVGKLNHLPSKSNLDFVGTVNVNNGTRYPRSAVRFSLHNVGLLHPTQKPLSLIEYLIRTYTNPGDTVLDPVIGSGTTGHACVNLDHRFIGIEQDPNYFQLAKTRIIKAQSEPRQLELIS